MVVPYFASQECAASCLRSCDMATSFQEGFLCATWVHRHRSSSDHNATGAAVCDHSAGLGSLSRPDNEASDEPATLASAQDSKDSKQQEGLTAFVGHVHTKDPAVKAATTGVETRSVGGVSNGNLPEKHIGVAIAFMRHSTALQNLHVVQVVHVV